MSTVKNIVISSLVSIVLVAGFSSVNAAEQQQAPKEPSAANSTSTEVHHHHLKAHHHAVHHGHHVKSHSNKVEGSESNAAPKAPASVNNNAQAADETLTGGSADLKK